MSGSPRTGKPLSDGFLARFGLHFVYQCHGGDGSPLFAPLETEMLCGRSFDRYPVIAYAHCTGHRGAHGVDMRPQFGPLHPDRTIDIPDLISFFAQQRRNPSEQYFRVDALEVIRRVGEVHPDVAQRCGAQQCVAYGVYRHVAVRMRHESFRVRNFDPAQHQGQPVGQRVYVVSVSYPEIRHRVPYFPVKIVEAGGKSKFSAVAASRKCKKPDAGYRELRCFCYICSSSFEKDIEKYPFNPKYGVNESDVFHMVQCLQQENRESVNFLYDPKQQKEGLSILKEIFETITSVQESDGIRYVYKLLKKKEFFKHWKKEEKRISVKFAELALQRLLEIMGYLSILHTEKYRGSFYEFNEGCTPRSSRSSDWNYPVDFWRGKNGIDKIAFQYWFGEYDELEKFWKQ